MTDPTPLTDAEQLAQIIRPWTVCDDGGRFDHGSVRAAVEILSSDWLAARVADARADAWAEGAQAMKFARLVQGESLPRNPYRAALAQATDPPGPGSGGATVLAYPYGANGLGSLARPTDTKGPTPGPGDPGAVWFDSPGDVVLP